MSDLALLAILVREAVERAGGVILRSPGIEGGPSTWSHQDLVEALRAVLDEIRSEVRIVRIPDEKEKP